ncbi:MAG: hypothetical protein AAFO57_11885, partial [Pseudomonadota bacterium]
FASEVELLLSFPCPGNTKSGDFSGFSARKRARLVQVYAIGLYAGPKPIGDHLYKAAFTSAPFRQT